MKLPYVSIIIPVYNAEKTIGLSLDSLRNQTYPYLELIFINDASQDESLKMLKDFRASFDGNKEVIIVLANHDVNRGVACARNTGLDLATGKYIYYVDADDQLDHHAIELLVTKAEKEDFDILGFNWYLKFSNNERKMIQATFQDNQDAIRLMLNGNLRWNLWIFFAKRKLYEDHNIRFIPGKNMGEDLMVSVKLFHYAKKVGQISDAFYHYGQSNQESLTKVYAEKHIQEVSGNLEEVENFLKANNNMVDLENLLAFLKLNIKLPMLISSQKKQYIRWLNLFPEVNKYAMENKAQSLRIRFLQFMATKKQFWFVKLHYYVIIRVVYGIIYH
ncbi:MULTISPECIES: glycosyltransferase family 2 protein [Sphingobacterium]|uniref:Glycosyltransferase family 2 protein n=1 Tax=Sphingobacterium tenebrionis TaxID=3111775 RepID=A0ABU8I651_9SPHI|nr:MULTISPECIES: glycosyltransferase family 2 protein [unclassified Sphingobacterium]QBR11237.1 glycosyltransferase family 2 protein [Sphingobacterium sp. CZ-2]